MGAYDIVPATSPHGGHNHVVAYPINASETFRMGEPVRMNADGELTECTTPVDAAEEIFGFAAGDGLDVDGNSRTAEELVSVYEPGDTLFMTRHFTTDSATAGETPTAAHIGDVGGFTRISGTWHFDINEEGVARIVRVLDSLKRDISSSGDTGVWVVFQMIGWQNNTTSLAVDAT